CTSTAVRLHPCSSYPISAPFSPIRSSPCTAGIFMSWSTVASEREATTRNQTVSIVRRSAGATLQGGTRAALELAYSVAQRHQMSVAVTEIPDAYPFGGTLDFDASRMRALFSFGEHCALAGQLWTDPIDALDQQPVRPLSQRPNAAQCPGAEGRGQYAEQVSLPRVPLPRSQLP